MFTVVISEKGGSGQQLEFDILEITIGRVHGNDVVLPRGNVSKRHAKITCNEGQYFITDLGSTNGTYVNGRRLKETTSVNRNDKIYIGEFILELDGISTLSGEEAKQGSFDGVVTSISSLDAAQKNADQNDEEKIDTDADMDPRTTIPDQVATSPGVATTESVEYQPGRRSLKKGAAEDLSNTGAVIKSLISDLAGQVRRINLDQLPMRIDSGTAERVRYILSALVEARRRTDGLPPDTNAGALVAGAFRAVVDLGPVGEWLVDDSIRAVRILDFETVFVLRDGYWESGEDFFDSEDDLERVMNVLTAGVEGSATHPGGPRSCRLPDSTVVTYASPPFTASGTVAIIQKRFDPSKEGIVFGKALPAFAIDIVEEAILSRQNIAVVGATHVARLEILSELMEHLPPQLFVTSVGRLPPSFPKLPKEVRLVLGGDNEQAPSGAENRTIDFAEGLGSDWIVLSGYTRVNILEAMSIASGRKGVMVEMPLSGTGSLAQELSMAVTGAGVVPGAVQIASLLHGSFDVILVASQSRDGILSVEQILTPKLSEAGSWEPEEKFTRS